MIDSLIETAKNYSPVEATAVITSVIYLLLAVKEDIRCWYFSLISIVLYFYVFAKSGLYAETALQFYYLGTTVYGYYTWKYKKQRKDGEKLIEKMSRKAHLISFLIILVGTAAAGTYLHTQTAAAYPYLDSFTTTGALVVTFLVTQKYLENWLYWIVVDGAGIYLFWKTELYLTALLFAAYTVMVVFGYFNWKRKYDEQTA